MEEISSGELFKQIRAAHRLVVAYYKRLFPILDQVASELELQFYRWDSIDFKHPAQKGTDIVGGKKWEWDLVPALNTSYFYYNAKDANTQKKGDWLLEFRVITDTGVLDDEEDDGGRKHVQNQDPLELEQSVEDAKSLLEIYLFSPSKEGSLNWYNGVWGDSEYPFITDNPKKESVDENNNNGIYANAFSLSLEKLVDDNIVNELIERIKEYRDVLLQE